MKNPFDKPTGLFTLGSMKQTAKISAKDRIMEAARDLFYRQGYNATGVQQIIDQAGVSKGAFYGHFKTKDDLGVAYLRQRNHDEITGLKEAVSQIRNPENRFIQFFDIMQDWMESSNYRGCAFANMSAEVPDCTSPIRKEAKFHYESFRSLIRDMAEDLIKSDSKYSSLKAEELADDAMMLIVGAVTNSGIYQDSWPWKQAKQQIKKLLN